MVTALCFLSRGYHFRREHHLSALCQRWFSDGVLEMKNLIAMQNITKSYHLGQNKIPALKTLHLEIGVGEFIALQGPSGSGKSTLLNLCGLLDQADSGHYLLKGIEIHNQSQRRLTALRREMIGFIFQGFNLVPVMTVFENVEYPLLLSRKSRPERRHAVDLILQRVGLSSHHKHRPDQLSGGQRQRVAIARALVKQPALVIADEPTANLDGKTANEIIALMHEISRESGSTFLIATHDERMSTQCDRVLTLIDGVLQ